jgi:DNA-binding transcriptional LysR family regulator
MHLLDIDQLRTFVAIADTGSFTRAAEIVHKTQSAVSMQMKRLEDRVGKAIFERDGRLSKLTDEGERLLDYARRIVRLNTECMASFRRFSPASRAPIRRPR